MTQGDFDVKCTLMFVLKQCGRPGATEVMKKRDLILKKESQWADQFTAIS